jgi:cytochrome P450
MPAGDEGREAMFAGIDTTWSAIGASLWHLAQHPGDRRRPAAEPDLMGTGVEELLRAYAPVTMARLVAQDFDFHGHPLKEGDWLLLPFPAANRDGWPSKSGWPATRTSSWPIPTLSPGPAARSAAPAPCP